MYTKLGIYYIRQGTCNYSQIKKSNLVKIVHRKQLIVNYFLDELWKYLN